MSMYIAHVKIETGACKCIFCWNKCSLVCRI